MKAEALINAIDSVPVVDYCRCGYPRSEHTYWQDRIYDYNGYRCPDSLGSDYQYDAVITNRHHAKARAAILSAEAADAEVIALRQRIADFLKALRPIEKSARWARDLSANSPSSHQELIREADEDWSAYEKAKTLLASGGDDRRG